MKAKVYLSVFEMPFTLHTDMKGCAKIWFLDCDIYIYVT